jgi:hypothetical protein
VTRWWDAARPTVARRSAARRTVAQALLLLVALALSACVTRVAQLNARHNARHAIRQADRLMRQGDEDSARTWYAQAAAAAEVVMSSETLTPEEQAQWRLLGGRAVAYSADCLEATRLLVDDLERDRLPVLEEVEARIALAACLLRERHMWTARETLRAFDVRRLAPLPRDQARDVRRRLTLWIMRLLLHENSEPLVDPMLAAFGPAPRQWEANAALYAVVLRERAAGPLIHAIRNARDLAEVRVAIAQLDTATIASERVEYMRTGTEMLELLLDTEDPSGAAAHHAGDIALEWLGNPWIALPLWHDAAVAYRDSPLAPLLLWKVASSPHDTARARIARDSLLGWYPASPDAARLRGERVSIDSLVERERAELLNSRWALLQHALRERRAARDSADR